MAKVLSFQTIKVEESEKRTGVIRKNGSTKLYVDLRYHGCRIQKSSGLSDTPENRKTLQDWVDRQKDKIEKGTFIFSEAFPHASAKERAYHTKIEGREYTPNPNEILFKDYYDSWQMRFLQNFESSTMKRDYKCSIDLWIIPFFGHLTFHQITGDVIAEFIGTLKHKKGKRRGATLSPQRIRNIMIPLRAILSSARVANRWELKIPDPFEYLRVTKSIPRVIKSFPKVFRLAEWMKIIENFDPYFKPVAEFMVHTGLSASEVAGLKTTDISDGNLLVRRSVVDGRVSESLKTHHRQREIPITQALRELIDHFISRQVGDHLITLENGGFFNNSIFRKRWIKALAKAQVSYCKPYVTRHTFAAWSLAVGVEPYRLVSLMGHGSKKMIYEVYGHYRNGLEADAGNIRRYFGYDFK